MGGERSACLRGLSASALGCVATGRIVKIGVRNAFFTLLGANSLNSAPPVRAIAFDAASSRHGSQEGDDLGQIEKLGRLWLDTNTRLGPARALLLGAPTQANCAQQNSVLHRAKELQTKDKVLHSKFVTVWDAQIDEKRMIQQDKKEEDNHLDAMVEVDRLKAFRMYEEREMEMHEGAKVIVEQIKDRQAQGMREQHVRYHERSFIFKQMEGLKEEEVGQARQRKIAADRLLHEVHHVIAAAMKIKEDKMLGEKLEEQHIIEYMEAKDQHERELEGEKRRVAAEKEKETARLRAMQEKAADKAAEMDALSAKRATEVSERADGIKDKNGIQKQEAMNRGMNAARLQQQQRRSAASESGSSARRCSRRMQSTSGRSTRRPCASSTEVLRNQTVAREEKAIQERRDFPEEGNANHSSIAAERKHLEKIKGKNIEELKESGPPEK